MHIERTLAETALDDDSGLGRALQYRLLEIGIGAGIVLAADHHDFIAAASRYAQSQVGPFGGLAAASDPNT